MSEDLISRSAAIDIVRNAKCSYPTWPHIVEAKERMITALEQVSTVSAEIVVHCRDCRYWSGDRDTGGTWGDCEKVGDRDNEGGASFDCSTCCSDYPDGFDNERSIHREDNE